jgi:hypothetical protein
VVTVLSSAPQRLTLGLSAWNDAVPLASSVITEAGRPGGRVAGGSAGLLIRRAGPVEERKRGPARDEAALFDGAGPEARPDALHWTVVAARRDARRRSPLDGRYWGACQGGWFVRRCGAPAHPLGDEREGKEMRAEAAMVDRTGLEVAALHPGGL